MPLARVDPPLCNSRVRLRIPRRRRLSWGRLVNFYESFYQYSCLIKDNLLSANQMKKNPTLKFCATYMPQLLSIF